MSDQAIDVTGPPRGLDRLLELQELDVAIDRLQHRLDELAGGEELAEARRQALDAEGRLGELRLAAEQVAVQQRKLEGDIDGLERKAESERGRLFDGSVANAKELQSIQAEVSNLEGRKARLEDQVLELMERREVLDGRSGPVENELGEARARVAEIEETSGRELVELERMIADRRAARESLVPAFSEELLDLYEELRRTKRGVGASHLVDGVCQACRQQLSPVFLQQLKRATGVRRCEYCRRILVMP